MSSHQNKSFIFLWTVNRFKLLELSAIFMFLGVSKHVSTVYILPMQNVKKTSRLKGVQGHHEPSETASLASLYIIRRITSKSRKTVSLPLDTSSSLCYSVSAPCNFWIPLAVFIFYLPFMAWNQPKIKSYRFKVQFTRIV